MVDLTLTTFLLAGFGGAFGGALYVLYNHLVAQKLYLTALEHLGAGFAAGLLAILFLGYAVPDSIYAIGPLVLIGYAGTDVVDSFVQSRASAAASAAAASTAAATKSA